jgi:hypothetical protein
MDGSSFIENWSQDIVPVKDMGEDTEIDSILANECEDSPVALTSSMMDGTHHKSITAQPRETRISLRIPGKKRSNMDNDEYMEEDLSPVSTKKQRGSKITYNSV